MKNEHKQGCKKLNICPAPYNQTHDCPNDHICTCGANNEPRSECCKCFGGLPQIISSGTGKKDGHACFCKCHTPKSEKLEKSVCCGAHGYIQNRGFNMTVLCSSCGKPFVAEEGEEVKFIEKCPRCGGQEFSIPEYICDKCHWQDPTITSTAPKEDILWCDRQGDSKGKECKCTCHQTGYPLPKDFPAPQKEEEDWEVTFNKFFPEMCSVYGLKNIPRGVYTDIKSLISSLLKEREEKARAAALQEAIDLSDKIEMQSSIEFNEWRAFKRFRNRLRDILKELTSK